MEPKEEMKTVSELQTQFYKETKTECINSQGEFGSDYVEWLQQKALSLLGQVNDTPTLKGEEIEYLKDAVNFYSKHAIENLHQKNITSKTREKYEQIRKDGSLVYPKLSSVAISIRTL